ncbi:MAG: hypothetical protein V5A46_04660 [Haloferacaceae archaeon]
MTPDHTPRNDSEVMASVDESPPRTAFVIADISTEEAWISVRQEDAVVLENWR